MLKAISIYNKVCRLIGEYESLNMFDEAVSSGQKTANKMELREIKLSSILLRIKAYKKLQMYNEAY